MNESERLIRTLPEDQRWWAWEFLKAVRLAALGPGTFLAFLDGDRVLVSQLDPDWLPLYRKKTT